jgi:hypothetical protein
MSQNIGVMPLKRVCRCDESEGGNDNFTLQFQGADCDFKTNGCVAHRDTMRHPRYVCDSFLKLVDIGTAIGEPAAREYVVYAL